MMSTDSNDKNPYVAEITSFKHKVTGEVDKKPRTLNEFFKRVKSRIKNNYKMFVRLPYTAFNFFIYLALFFIHKEEDSAKTLDPIFKQIQSMCFFTPAWSTGKAIELSHFSKCSIESPSLEIGFETGEITSITFPGKIFDFGMDYNRLV